MPAAKQSYYKASDIMKILDVKKSKAYDIMHECEPLGIVFRDKGTLRIDIEGFEAYCEAHKNAKGKTKSRLDQLIEEGAKAAEQCRQGRRRKEVFA
ncbi:MAG: hypothetical protein PHS57_06055 [Alphaproteobacteria bacterium]|nr:hypothetical protein [Alphaproteobacteria bacterium]